MGLTTNQELWTALPFQVLEYSSGVILRRGVTQILVEGDNALESILLILLESSGKLATKDQILNRFPPKQVNEIRSLLEELIVKRFLVSANNNELSVIQEERCSDVFNWQLGKKHGELDWMFGDMDISILGVNQLSKRIFDELLVIGFKKIRIIDYPPLRGSSIYLKGEKFQKIKYDIWKQSKAKHENCVVIGCSEFGGQALLLEINQFCVDNQMPFFPIVLENMKAYIGPLILPGETACLQCLRSRQNAHMTNAILERYFERYTNEGKEVAAIHPSILAAAAPIAAFELVRSFGKLQPNYSTSLIELDMLNGKMESKHILKIPRCKICSSFNRKSAIKSVKSKP